jgi:hypothetical protein
MAGTRPFDPGARGTVAGRGARSVGPTRTWHASAVAGVDLVDETFLVAAPGEVAAAVRDARHWPLWWPDLRLTVFQDRAEQGIRWNVGGALTGSMEVWLEPYGDGVILHYYLRCAPPPGRSLSESGAVREIRRRALRAKQVFWRLKDELERGRPPGEPRAPAGSGPAA